MHAMLFINKHTKLTCENYLSCATITYAETIQHTEGKRLV